MTTRPWMPLYVGDYLADTGHLTATEHGAYLLLLMHHWQRGSLPADDALLARIARIHPPHWTRTKAVLLPFFEIQEDGSWMNKRLVLEISRAGEIAQKRSQAALQMHHGASANAGQLQTQLQLQSKKTSLNGEKTTKSSSVIWVTEDSPNFIPLATRWQQERKRKASPSGSRSASGIGFYFPAEWINGAAQKHQPETGGK